MMDEIERIRPDPKMVHLIDCAIDEVNQRIGDRTDLAFWFSWAAGWKAGKHSPADCVAVSHQCSRAGWESLGQIAWGAKEACYTSVTSPWLVIRYVADAMVAFGVKYPDRSLLEPRTIESQPVYLDALSLPLG